MQDRKTLQKSSPLRMEGPYTKIHVAVKGIQVTATREIQWYIKKQATATIRKKQPKLSERSNRHCCKEATKSVREKQQKLSGEATATVRWSNGNSQKQATETVRKKQRQISDEATTTVKNWQQKLSERSNSKYQMKQQWPWSTQLEVQFTTSYLKKSDYVRQFLSTSECLACRYICSLLTLL